MANLSRRKFIIAAGATSALTACVTGDEDYEFARLDARVESAFEFLYENVEGGRELSEKATGVLMIPLVSKAGFVGIGGAYGRGALQVGGITVDYYTSAAATYGLQLGVEQFSSALFFMTEDALNNFRNSAGFTLSAEAGYVVQTDSGNLGVDTATSLAPVVAVVFGQAGLIVGATVEGSKYTRIAR